jgi:heme-degrading monooxygenase HmoA
MVTMITLHIVNGDARKQAMALLKKNTELARKAKGFVSRDIFFAQGDPLKGYSITTWKTRADMKRFLKSPERPPLEHEGPDKTVYEITPKGRVLLFTRTYSDVFDVVPVP